MSIITLLSCKGTNTQDVLDLNFLPPPPAVNFDVVSTIPPTGAVDGYVGLGYDVEKISIVFSNDVDTATLVGALSIDNGLTVNPIPEYVTKTKTATYALTNKPSLTTSDCTTFYANLSESVKDTKGNALVKGSYNWPFIPGPCVLSATPANFSTSVSSISNNSIVLVFNQKLTATNLNAQVTLTPNPANSSISIASRTLSGNNLTIKISGAPSSSYSYQFIISKNLLNSSGRGMAFDYKYRFSAGKFFDNLDGTVSDKSTNFTWMKCAQGPSGQDSLVYNTGNNNCSSAVAPSLSFAFCTTNTNNCNGGVNGNPLQPPPWLGGDTSPVYNTCQALNTVVFSGRSNWRVPSVTEYATLLRYDVSYPALDAAMFPLTSGNHWSSSTSLLLTGNAWYVAFNNGQVVDSTKTTVYHVRCVATGP